MGLTALGRAIAITAGILASAGCQTAGGDRNSLPPQQYDDFRSDFRGDMRYPGPGLTGGGGG
jgi:hypothetical protein